MNACRLALVLAALPCVAAESGETALVRHAKNDGSGTAWAVRAPDGPLAFTAQVFAKNLWRDARAQTDEALDALGVLLAPAGGDLKRVVRLNVYVADDAATPAVDAAIAARFAGTPPAVTLVRTALPREGARVALDAVTAVSRAPSAVEVMADAAVMPAGGKVFVSGQAEKAPDLAGSARLTMASLHRSLAHLGLAKTDVVQVKAFIKPFSEHAVARAEVAKSFEGGPVPPLVLVEWQSELATEIELVASGRALVRPSRRKRSSRAPQRAPARSPGNRRLPRDRPSD